MKKYLAVGLVLASACKTQTHEEIVSAPVPVTSPAAARASGPRPALDAFLAAIKSEDIQALSAVWGDKDGPVRDSKLFAREELEKREVILIRCFKFDSYRVVGETQAANSERIVQTELTRGTSRRIVDFFTVRGPDRWYVRYANTTDLCKPS